MDDLDATVKALKDAFNEETERHKQHSGDRVLMSETGPYGRQTISALITAVEVLASELKALKKDQGSAGAQPVNPSMHN